MGGEIELSKLDPEAKSRTPLVFIDKVQQAHSYIHTFPELTQTPVHRVGDAIQSSHPLSSPSPPALNLSQHQGLFQ